MHYVGEAVRKLVTDVPTIGFATYNKISNKEKLKTVNNPAFMYIKSQLMLSKLSGQCTG